MVKRLVRHIWRNRDQFSRYFVVGVSGVILDLGVFYLLQRLFGLSPVWSVIVTQFILINYILWNNGFPMLIIEYKNRNSYYSALERSQVKKDDFIFLQWFLKRYMKEYGRYLN